MITNSHKILVSFKENKYQNYKKYNSFEEIQITENYHNIKYINCANNNLKHLPDELPRSLKGLYCGDNILGGLPTLPLYLEELDCRNNIILELPILPLTLKE